MKQLQPKTIIAIGLPGSLLLNCVVAALIFSKFESSLGDWRLATATVAVSVWLLIAVPTFIGMAVIRKRIGKKNERIQKIRTAARCLLTCFAIGATTIYAGYQLRESMFHDFPVFASLAFLVGVINIVLFAVTAINILIRFFTPRNALTKHI